LIWGAAKGKRAPEIDMFAMVFHASPLKRFFSALILKDTKIMAVTRTFSIIKPDATRRNLTGAVTRMLEEAGLRVVASKRIHMTEEQAKGFYAVHAERPFYGELVAFMMSGPVVVQVLEGEDAVKRNRDIMGATNPADAAAGTIRGVHAESIEANTVHGSDSEENAATEIAFFFNADEIVG
jgi:nucleoside-diphosphate kinase